MAGQLWVIDGIDGSGKATQVDLLVKRLRQHNTSDQLHVHHEDFPHYTEKPWGVLIRQYLDGKFGSLASVGPYPASLLYAGDRGVHAADIKQKLDNGDWILCDRYTPSNAAFQSAKLMNDKEKDQYIEWLFKTEYELFGIPKPTGVILLYIPVEVSRRRTEERRTKELSDGKGKVGHTDIHEQNELFMQKVQEEYVKLAKQFGWHIVNTVENNIELSRDALSDKIWDIIAKSM